MASKSPFIVIDNFLTPLECEKVVERSFFNFPNEDADGRSIKSVTRNYATEDLVLERMDDIIDMMEEYYEYEHGGILPIDVEYYPERSVPEGTRCENALYNGKWMRVNDHDFTAVLFLKDDNMSTNFDDYYEVYGARLQFPNYNFSFHPQRGQLVIFPSSQHFLNSVLPPSIGDLYQLRMQFVGMKPYTFDPTKFPGNHTTWFK
ncbi:hypothetical protein [Stenotrophomonas phage RAS14]